MQASVTGKEITQQRPLGRIIPSMKKGKLVTGSIADGLSVCPSEDLPGRVKSYLLNHQCQYLSSTSFDILQTIFIWHLSKKTGVVEAVQGYLAKCTYSCLFPAFHTTNFENDKAKY